MSSTEQVSLINEASTDPVPEMAAPIDNSVQLFRGLYNSEEDAWYDTAYVRELTGEDEEYLATFEAKDGVTYFEYMTEVLRRAVLRIGPLDVQQAPVLLDRLILSDRDMLFLGIVRVTYGYTRSIAATCRKCGEMNDVEIHLDEDFPIVAPEHDPKKPITVNLSNGATISVRLPNGEDTSESNRDTKTGAEVTTKLISRVAIFNDGEEPADRLAWSKALSIADRRLIAKSLVSAKMGPSLEEVNTQCAHCDSDMTVRLDWVSLLFN
jgi:hypothetical protein